MKKTFEQIFTDCTKLATKIPQANYLPSGRYSIVDQGQTQIAGYADSAEGLFTDIPAIVFGDHTRIIKYINEPFFIGADGVKVLKTISDGADYKYLFYALTNVKIPNTGYNRHFKWLKESSILLPNLSEQKRIAERLDKVQELIALQKEQLKKLDDLIKSRFIDLFGDPITNPKGWPTLILPKVAPKISRKVTITSLLVWLLNLDKVESNTGRVVSKERVPLSQVGNSTYYFQNGDVLYSKLRPYLNKVVLVDEDGFCTSELLPLHPKPELCNATFLAYLLRHESVVTFLSNKVAGAKMPRVDMATLRNFPVILPPLSLQTQFADFVAKIETQKGLLTTRLSHLETLYKSLMQEYFG